MKTIIVAVKDLSIPAFMQPTAVRAAGQAIRGFQDEANRRAQENPVYNHPQDFELWQLASFDEENGQFENDQRLLIRGVDAKKTDENQL